MTPVALEETWTSKQVTFAKNQPEYKQLPALIRGDGRVLICWNLTWRERFGLLFKGKLFHQVATHNNPLQPIKLTMEMPDGF